MSLFSSPTAAEITTTQLFSRATLGALWGRRADFDVATVSMLDALYRNRKKGTTQGQQDITYKLSRSRAGQLGFGRLYGSKTSLEHLQTECRASLCRDLYHDIDMVNAQPVLMTQVVRRELTADMPELENYVDNRDALLQQLIDRDNVGRDDAKATVIAVLYGSVTKDPLLLPLATEVRTRAKELSRQPKYAELFAALRHEKNQYGSFLAHVLQTEERRCMLAMRDHLTLAGWQVDILAYDGVMVRRRKDASITDELTDAICLAIKSATGYEIAVREKEQIGFDLPEAHEDAAESAYSDMKAKFEEDHFYFMPTNTVCAISCADGIHHFSMEHAQIAFNNLILPGGKDDDPNLFIKRWIKDPSRRYVKRLVYKHQADCDSNEASLFTGFAYEDMEGEDPTAVALFRNILSACAGDDPTVTEYILRYFAHIIQKPFEQPGTAVIFTSHTHGTGKDTLLNLMRHIIGRHSKHYSSDAQFWNCHDTGKEGALLIHLEEAGARANKAKCGELKALITADTLDINPKGVKAYNVPNVARIMMTTNEPDPVKLEESDRRFVIIRPSDRLHALGLDWWAAQQEQLVSSAFLRTVGQYLSNIDLTGWNPRKMPMTETKAEIMEMSKPAEQIFLEDYISHITEATDLNPTGLFKEYKDWYRDQSMDPKFVRISPNSLGMHVARYNGKLFIKRHVETGTLYRFSPPAAEGGVGGS